MSILSIESQAYPAIETKNKKIILFTKNFRFRIPRSSTSINLSQPISVYVKEQDEEYLLPIKDLTLEALGNVALLTSASIFLIWLLAIKLTRNH